ncbi:MAG: hypothetical protein Q7S28_02825 [bacterium]|nr:hypothetical protein [bacterium]
MVETKLPFGAQFTCTYCGATWESVDNPCANELPWEEPDLSVGEAVRVFSARRHGGKPGDMEEDVYGVRRLFYSDGRGRYSGSTFYYKEKRKVLHELCVEIARAFDSKDGITTTRPWRPGDNGYSFTTLAYADFLLWRKGDRAKLESAGLLAPQKKTIFSKLFGRS